MTCADSTEDLINLSERLAKDVLRSWAPRVDEENRFPSESVAALRDAGLMAYMVPERLGGHCSDLKSFCRIAASLGGECLSTALIWSMHCQQVAVLADHGGHAHEHILHAVVEHGALVASVTTEAGPGDLLRVNSPIFREGNQLRIQRMAPIVSYGKEADFYLVTMKTAKDCPPNDVSLVLVAPGDGVIEVKGKWDAMGMRGTQSIPMNFDVLVDPRRIVGTDFRSAAVKTMVPVGHLGWAASWYGAASGLLSRFIKYTRESKGNTAICLDSDLFVSRLAEMRLQLDLVWALIGCVSQDLEVLQQTKAPFSSYEDIQLQIRVNNLKLASSKLAFSVADNLVELAGMRHGYLRGGSLGLERAFRDLRSAQLMYHNDRLRRANGTLMFVEHTSFRGAWSESKKAKDLASV